MPTWEDISPYTDRATRAPRLTATNALLGLSILGFVATGMFMAFKVDFSPALFDAHAAIGRLHLWQFLTYSFLQFVDPGPLFWFILIGYVCYLFGNELEIEIGTPRMVAYYLSFAAYGALAHAAYQYVGAGDIPARGFFGPACGIFVISGLRAPYRMVKFFFVIPMRIITAVILGGIIVVFYCIGYFRSGEAPFFILGAGLSAWAIFALEPKLDEALARLSQWSAAQRNRDAHDVRREVDEILDKISRQGIGSLTRRERKTLQRGSAFLNRPPEEAPRRYYAPPALKLACLLAPLAIAVPALHAWGDDVGAGAAKILAGSKYESVNHGAFRVFVRRGSSYHLFAAQTLQNFTDAMCREYGESLGLRPPDAGASCITVYLVDSREDLGLFELSEAMADPARDGGYFNPDHLEIAVRVDPSEKLMDADRRTLQHEMTHALLRLAAPDLTRSPWISEGLAGTFEDGAAGGLPPRAVLEGKAWAEHPGELSIETIIGMRMDVLAGDPGRRFCRQARLLTAFLMDSPQHRPGLLEYCREEAKAGPAEAFRKAVGNPAEVETLWMEWLRGLK